MFQYEGDGKLTAGNRVLGRSALSIAVHLVGGVAALYISQVVPTAPPKAMKSALTYMAAVTMPVIPDEPAVVDVAALDLPKVQPVEVELTHSTEVAPQPLPEIAPAEVPVPMTAVAPQVVQPRLQEPPPSKEVTVGAFAAAEVPIRPAETRQQTAAAGFDAAPPAVQHTRQTQMVADAGFGTVATESKRQPPPRAVADTGFGAAQVGAKAPTPPVRRIVESGFGDTQPAPAPTAKPALAPERVDVPLEVLSKPTPSYTAEAREMKLEGEVSLEVEFCASGTVRVLRVVRGLGYGLDEEAIRAAERIKFKPAQSHGRAVDVRTTVHITFRLS